MHFRNLRKSQGANPQILEVEVEQSEHRLNQFIEYQGVKTIYRFRLFGFPIILLLSSFLVTSVAFFVVLAGSNLPVLLPAFLCSVAAAGLNCLNRFLTRPRGPKLGEMSKPSWPKKNQKDFEYLFRFYTGVISRMIQYEENDGDLRDQLYLEFAMQKDLLAQVICAAVLSVQYTENLDLPRQSTIQKKILKDWTRDLQSLFAEARNEFLLT